MRISIIIPVYNAERNIKKCVNSIIPQLTEEDEILLLNDGSTDNSLLVLRELEKQWENIRVIDKKNEGVALTRNRGIQEARGKYICFVDNDDFVDADYISVFYSAIQQNDYDIVLGGYRRVTDQRTLFEYQAKDTQWYKLMVVAPWAKIYRRDFLLKNNITFLDNNIGEDVYFNFKAYNCTDRIKIINYTGYNWWFNEDSISNTSQRGFQKDVSIIELLDKLYQITGKQKLYNFYYVRYIVWYLLFSGRKGTDKDFICEYKRGIKWLEEKKIPVYFPIFSRYVKGEKISNRIIIFGFIMIHKLGLTGIFAKLYCQG